MDQPVKAEQYLYALGLDIDLREMDTLMLDYRGRSPAVDSVSPGYMTGKAVVASPSQLQFDVGGEDPSFLFDLMEEAFEDDALLAMVDRVGPVPLKIELDRGISSLKARAVIDTAASSEVRRYMEVAEGASSFSSDDFDRMDGLDDVLTDVETYDLSPGDVPDRVVAEADIESYTFDSDDRAGYVFGGEDPRAVVFYDHGTDPGMAPGVGVKVSSSPTAIVEGLREGGDLRVNEGLDSYLAERRTDFLGLAMVKLASESEDMAPEISLSLDQEQELRKHIKLRRLAEGDVSLESTMDAYKLAAMTVPQFDSFNEDMADAVLDNCGVTMHELEFSDRGYEDIVEAYEAWNPFEGEYDEAVELVEGLDYTAHSIYEFCDEFGLPADAGLFVSALVNEYEGDEVVLPDMTLVDYVGYRNEEDLLVEGNTGAYAAAEMRDGRMAIEGFAGSYSAERMSGGELHVDDIIRRYAGQGMTGGTVYAEQTGTGLAEGATGGELYFEKDPLLFDDGLDTDAAVYVREDGTYRQMNPSNPLRDLF